MKILSRTEEGKSSFDPLFASVPKKVRQAPYDITVLPEVVDLGFLQLGPNLNPCEFWVAFDGSEVIGRVGASVFEKGKTAAVGFFEVNLRRGDFKAVSAELLEKAGRWAKEQGCQQMIGPMNFNTWFPYRFRTGEALKLFSWEPVNPPEYPKLWEASGFSHLEGYHSTGSGGLEKLFEGTKKSVQKAKDAGYSFRVFNAERMLEDEVPKLHHISMQSFKDASFFRPLPLELFRELYVPIAKKMDFSYSFFALDPNGKEVGFFFGFREGNALVLKSVGVLAEAQGKGLSNGLTHYMAEQALKNGLTEFISALVRDGIQSESYAKKGETLWKHTYSLYSKSL